MASFADFMREDSGQGMSEYSIIVGVVAIAAIAVMIAFRDKIGNFFKTIGGGLDKASSEAKKGY